jgi:hypothetical protein
VFCFRITHLSKQKRRKCFRLHLTEIFLIEENRVEQMFFKLFCTLHSSVFFISFELTRIIYCSSRSLKSTHFFEHSFVNKYFETVAILSQAFEHWTHTHTQTHINKNEDKNMIRESFTHNSIRVVDDWERISVRIESKFCVNKPREKQKCKATTITNPSFLM